MSKRILYIVMLLGLLFGSSAAYCDSAGQASAAAVRQPFATEDIGFAHHLALGLGSVVIIAMLGWLTVVLGRRYGLSRRLAAVGGEGHLRVLDVRRVTQRLHVAAIQISKERIVIVADNGHALEKLGEIPARPESTQGGE